MRLLLLFFLFHPFFSSAQTSPDNFFWLRGKWVMVKGKKVFTEHWKSDSQGNLKAQSTMKNGNKIVWTERCRISGKKGSWFYESFVSDQAKQGWVRFELISSENNTYTFENRKHDFPNRIAYQRLGEDSLLTVVSGVQNGKSDTLWFPMKRQMP